MGRRKKRDEWDAADKLKVVKEYLAGHDSFVKLGRKYQLNESSIRTPDTGGGKRLSFV